MKKILAVFIAIIIIASCATPPPQESINLQPMYGLAKKKPFQLEADKKFLQMADDNFSSRREAAEYYTTRGWDFYKDGDLTTAIKRFNQAWLLDSLYCEPYWGFGNIYGLQGKAEESNKFLRKAQELQCDNPNILEAITSNWFVLYDKSKDSNHLDNAGKSIKENLIVTPNNARVLNQQAVYFYHRQKYDSASVYVQKALQLDSTAVTPAFKEAIKNNLK